MVIRRTRARTAQFVIKISKYCNLRCSYCYEFVSLGQKQRMSLSMLEAIFRNIALEVQTREYEDIEFVWHGGEPLLVPLEYYDAIGKLQKKIFGTSINVLNAVQTNLTVLTERHIDYLEQRRFFSRIGVSTDVFGDQRVDIRGRDTTHLVHANMQRLIDRNIPFGAIVVLAQNTLPRVREIFRYFDQLNNHVRFLPFFLTAEDEIVASQQIQNHGLTGSEVANAFKELFDEWLSSTNGIAWSPLEEYLDFALAFISKQKPYRYDKLDLEAVFIVNIDGTIWGTGDTYSGNVPYGSLATDGLPTILKSEARQRAIKRTNQRLQDYCQPCPYYGACPGFFVGDASRQDEALLKEAGCPVRETIRHILDKLQSTKLMERLTREEAQPQIM
ncbi:uncharacterized protein AB7M49_001808 [Bradyrhizobium elkanii]